MLISALKDMGFEALGSVYTCNFSSLLQLLKGQMGVEPAGIILPRVKNFKCKGTLKQNKFMIRYIC